jgi:hypothetical protein
MNIGGSRMDMVRNDQKLPVKESFLKKDNDGVRQQS